MKFFYKYIFFLLVSFETSAQAKPSYTQYVLNNFILNPAIAGIENYTDARISFRNQWTGIKSEEYINKHLTPRHNVLQQRIPISNGFRSLLQQDQIQITTGTIDCFDKNQIVVDKKRYNCNVAILCTGFNMNVFRFPIQIDNVTMDTTRLNWYKGFMFGGIPNY